MRGVNADWHPRQPPHHRHVSEVDEVAMRIAHVGLDAPAREDDFVVAFARQVFGGVKRFAQGYAKTTLEQHREFLLSSQHFQQFKVLGVARTDLKYHSGRRARVNQDFINLVDM